MSAVLGPVVAVALMIGVCAPVVVVAPQVSGATTGGISGDFAGYSPGEFWGGGNPAEKCLSCSATSLIGEDSAQSIQQGQPVNPTTGDFSTHATLFSVPTAAGTFGLSLTYDAQRAISQGLDPTAYPTYERPGPFGWGWQSSLTVSALNVGTSVEVNEADGAQVVFRTIGTKSGEIPTDACPRKGGFYPDWQKHTVPGSSTAFCAAERVDAQLGTTTTHTQHLSWQFNVAGGAQEYTFNYFGRLSDEGNIENPNAVSFAYDVAQGTTHCPTTTTHSTTSCDIETDLVAESWGVTRRIVTELNGFRIATAVFAPTGAEYSLGYDPNGNTLLTSITNPTGDVSHYGYAATQGTGSRGYKNSMTSTTDPDGYTSTIVYATGMVTHLIDPSQQYTVYTYSNDTCGTLSGCFKTDTSQTTTVAYDDGEFDRDYYNGGVLLTNCYGPSSDTCTDEAQWNFHYQFDTNTLPGGTNTEIVYMPDSMHATITTDAAGNVVAYTDPEGNTSHYMWNDTGGNNFNELCWSAGPKTTIPSSASCTNLPTYYPTSATYNKDGEKVSATNQTGDTTHYGYYDNGLLCWTAPPSVSGGSTCNNGAGTGPTGAPAGSTAYRYDVESDLVQKTVAYGTPTVETTTSQYDVYNGRVTAVIPPDGQGHGGFGSNLYETTTNYRASGLVQTTKAPDGLTTSFTYDADGNVVTETTPTGVTTTTYDKENRVCWTHLGTAKITGNCTSRPSGSTSYAYLATTSAPTTVTNQVNDTTTYTYGDAEYPTKATEIQDPMGDEVTYAAYTVYGQTCISGPVNPGSDDCADQVPGDTWALYDNDGQVGYSTDPGGTPTTYTYSDANFPTEPTKVTYGPGDDSRSTTYTYRSDGSLMFEKDAEGHTSTVAYNKDGELCMTAPEVWFPVCTPPSVTGASKYTYNTAGERKSMTDNYGTANAVTDHYTYDPDGHLLSATTDNARTTSYQYNDAGQVSCIAYPVKSGANCANSPSATNTVVKHTYNGAGELDKTTDWLGNAVSYSGYTPKGEVGQITYPALTGESITYRYSKAGLTTAINYSGPISGSDSYGHNQDSQLSSATGLHGFSSPSDTYNDYGRVSTASAPSSPTSMVNDTFQYHANGTIASITPSSGPTQTDTYNTLEELTSQTAPVTTVPIGKKISKVGSLISAGVNPLGVDLTPNGGQAYVVDIGKFLSGKNGTVVDILTSTKKETSSITAGYAPDALALEPSGTLVSTAYLVDAGTKKVVPITLWTDTKKTPISVGTTPDAIAIMPSGARAYVANESSNNVTPITLSTKTAKTPISVGSDPDAIAITANNSMAYVANAGSDSVTPITLSSGTAESAIAVGAAPEDIAVNPSGSMAYVTAGTHTVIPITLTTKTKKTAITVGKSPSGIVIVPQGNTAFVANQGSNSITTITLPNNDVIATTTVGASPSALSVTRSAKELYAVIEGSTAVLPMTLTTRDAGYTPHYGYNADGDRCWSAPSTSSGPCTAAPAGATSYGWNSYNQLCWSGPTTDATASCTSPPSGTTTYRYSGTGLRSKETSSSGTTSTFTYDTVTGGGTPQDIDNGSYAYIYGPMDTAPVEQIDLGDGVVSFLSSTPTGVQAVFNTIGGTQEEAAYTPYGTQVIQKGSKATAFGFQGAYQTSSGLDYMVNRYYTSASAQFLSVDPLLTKTHQPYAFTGDDPLNATDPLGLTWFWVNTTWYTYKPGSTKAKTHGAECGTELGFGSNETTADHCGSKWCSGYGRCTTHAARAFDQSYGAALSSGTPTYDAGVAAFLVAWHQAVVKEYLDAMYAASQTPRAVMHGLTDPGGLTFTTSRPSPSSGSTVLDELGHWVVNQFQPHTSPLQNIAHNAAGAGACLNGGMKGFDLGDVPGAAAGCVYTWEAATATGPGITTVLNPNT